MKKLFLYLSAILLLASCEDPLPENNQDDNPPQEVKAEIKVEVNSLSFTQEKGNQTLSFTSTADWTAEVINTRADSWCIISPQKGGAGNAKITVNTTANETPDDRTASIVIRSGTISKTVTISQKQKDALTVTAAKYEIRAEGGEILIEVKANVDFEYEVEEAAKEWVKYVETRAMKTSTLVFNVAENDDIRKREAKIIVRSGNLKESISIYQEGTLPSIVISQNEYFVTPDGETISVEVRSNVDVSVELPSDVKWISENITRATSTNTYRFDIAPNEEYDQRSAKIKFTNKENGLSEQVTVTQAQKDAIVLAKSEYEFGADV